MPRELELERSFHYVRARAFSGEGRVIFGVLLMRIREPREANWLVLELLEVDSK